jgi:hypothetical protein
MCGVSQEINFESLTPIRSADIETMTKSISRRGPDDEFDGPLGFGFRRLSIIDLSGGHQPMSNKEETLWVIPNQSCLPVGGHPLLMPREPWHHWFEARQQKKQAVRRSSEVQGMPAFTHAHGWNCWCRACVAAIVKHDCLIGDHAHTAARERLAGGGNVGRSPFVGARRDVAAGAAVVGKPSRRLEGR